MDAVDFLAALYTVWLVFKNGTSAWWWWIWVVWLGQSRGTLEVNCRRGVGCRLMGGEYHPPTPDGHGSATRRLRYFWEHTDGRAESLRSAFSVAAATGEKRPVHPRIDATLRLERKSRGCDLVVGLYPLDGRYDIWLPVSLGESRATMLEPLQTGVLIALGDASLQALADAIVRDNTKVREVLGIKTDSGRSSVARRPTELETRR